MSAHRKIWFTVFIVLTLLLSSTAAGGAQGVTPSQPAAAPGEISSPAVPHAAAGSITLAAPTQITATTIITVTSTTDDYTDGNSVKCSDVLPEECTLRRAINQAYPLSSGARPVAIVFDIPTGDPGYNPGLGVWKITLTGTTAHALRDLNGQTIVDGSTQPGGRSDGPKIIVDGDGSKNYGFILRNHGNQVRGLAMQNFNTAHISVSSDGNVVEDCWFGLSDDGMYLSAGDQTTTEGGSGVALASGASGNVVRDNVFAGFYGTAAAIRGDDNLFAGNRIGMRADGTVPLPAQFDQHPCLGGAWAGGVGITVEGNNNQIGGPSAADGNRFAGLFTDTTDQSPAIKVFQSGQGQIIQNNVIGLDVSSDAIGVCGRGLDFGSGPQDMRVIDNVLVETGLSAILMNGSSLNGNTLRGNIIRRATQWPPEQGFNPFPEDAIAYGPTVPAALRGFRPAQVTAIDGTSVSGTSGAGSDCPSCTIELFLDDGDGITETLQSLDVVTADANGDWTATLPAPLQPGQGLRTMSTVPDNFTIIGLDTGTTSNLSVLYGADYRIFLPLVVK